MGLLDAPFSLRARLLDSLAVRLSTRYPTMRAMQSPPTVSVNTTNALASGQFYSGTDISQTTDNTGVQPVVSLWGADRWVRAGNASPDIQCIRPTNITSDRSSGRTSGVACIAFTSARPTLTLGFKAIGTNILIKIDGEFVSLSPITLDNSGAINFINLSGLASSRKRIEVYVSGASCVFNGVWSEQTDRIMPAEKVGPTGVLVGDSFVEGNTAGQGTVFDSFGFLLWQWLGVSDIVISGLGSTGFIATSSGTRYNFVERFPLDIATLSRAPGFIIGCQSINDSVSPAADVLSSVQQFVTLSMAAFPAARVLIGAPSVNKGAGIISVLQYEQHDAVRAWCASNGVDYISDIERPFDGIGFVPQTASIVASPTGSSPSITITTSKSLLTGQTYRVDGTSIRVFVRARLTQTQFTVATAGTLTAGMTLTQVGPGYLTGSGRVGGLAGWGNADLSVGNSSGTDVTHPSPFGHAEKAFAWWAELRRIFGSVA